VAVRELNEAARESKSNGIERPVVEMFAVNPTVEVVGNVTDTQPFGSVNPTSVFEVNLRTPATESST
jgi:hypothetical protein